MATRKGTASKPKTTAKAEPKTPSKRGGRREGAGRKPKLEEEKVKSFALSAMANVYGSEEQAWVRLAKLSQQSYHHMRLLFEYAYGKPVDRKDVEIGGNAVTIVVNTDD